MCKGSIPEKQCCALRARIRELEDRNTLNEEAIGQADRLAEEQARLYNRKISCLLRRVEYLRDRLAALEAHDQAKSDRIEKLLLEGSDKDRRIRELEDACAKIRAIIVE